MSAVNPSAHSVNPRGIPAAPFVENVDAFMGNDAPEETLGKLQEMLSKYKFMEKQWLQRRSSLENKLPEIRKSLETLNVLEKKQELALYFELNETLYAKANVPPTDHVSIWLGANVMVDYPLEEAIPFLQQRFDKATTSIKEVDEDLDYLREQITTMEVNVARVYNWDVQRRRQLAASKTVTTAA